MTEDNFVLEIYRYPAASSAQLHFVLYNVDRRIRYTTHLHCDTLHYDTLMATPFSRSLIRLQCYASYYKTFAQCLMRRRHRTVHFDKIIQSTGSAYNSMYFQIHIKEYPIAGRCNRFKYAANTHRSNIIVGRRSRWVLGSDGARPTIAPFRLHRWPNCGWPGRRSAQRSVDNHHAMGLCWRHIASVWRLYNSRQLGAECSPLSGRCA